MKFETLILQGLFAASVFICVLVLGAMLSARPATSSLAVKPPPVAMRPLG